MPISLARKIAAAEKEAAEARAGKNFYPVGSRSDSFGAFPPTPFLFARPSGKILIKIQNLDFRQKRFGLCRIIAQKKKALKPSFFVVVLNSKLCTNPFPEKYLMMPRLRHGKTNRSGGAGRKRGAGKRNARPALAFRRRRISYFALRNAPPFFF